MEVVEYVLLDVLLGIMCRRGLGIVWDVRLDVGDVLGLDVWSVLMAIFGLLGMLLGIMAHCISVTVVVHHICHT